MNDNEALAREITLECMHDLPREIQESNMRNMEPFFKALGGNDANTARNSMGHEPVLETHSHHVGGSNRPTGACISSGTLTLPPEHEQYIEIYKPREFKL